MQPEEESPASRGQILRTEDAHAVEVESHEKAVQRAMPQAGHLVEKAEAIREGEQLSTGSRAR